MPPSQWFPVSTCRSHRVQVQGCRCRGAGAGEFGVNSENQVNQVAPFASRYWLNQVLGETGDFVQCFKILFPTFVENYFTFSE